MKTINEYIEYLKYTIEEASESLKSDKYVEEKEDLKRYIKEKKEELEYFEDLKYSNFKELINEDNNKESCTIFNDFVEIYITEEITFVRVKKNFLKNKKVEEDFVILDEEEDFLYRTNRLSLYSIYIEYLRIRED